jgi:hypothetical protein
MVMFIRAEFGMDVRSRDDIWRADDINPVVFAHIYQQIDHILRLRPRTVLEIGPGDYTVTDFLRRRGMVVKTFDRREGADYVGDMRAPPPMPQMFDLILASEVFEHVKFHYLERILAAFKSNLNADGRFVISLPYTTLRLFPRRAKFGRCISCEGRLHTGVPAWAMQPFATLLRACMRLMKRHSLGEALEYYVLPEYPDDRFDRHHWDAGSYPTTLRRIREVMSVHFKIVEETKYLDTNCVFFVLAHKPDQSDILNAQPSIK